MSEIKTEIKENGDCSYTITDAHTTADILRWLLTQDTKETILFILNEEALAEQPAQQEPLIPFRHGCKWCGKTDGCEHQNPKSGCVNHDCDKCKAQQEPLTQTQVVEGFCKQPHDVQFVSVFSAGVRFAEAAHGIKGGT